MSDLEKKGRQNKLHVRFGGKNEHENNNQHSTHQLKAKFEQEISRVIWHILTIKIR